MSRDAATMRGSHAAGLVAGQPTRPCSPAPDPIPGEEIVSFRLGAAGGIGSSARPHILRCYAFDTDVEISLGGTADAARDAAAKVLDALRRYERMLSRFLPHSDIARLNAAHGAPVEVDGETYDLLSTAIRYCSDSLGAFDITVGAATRLWNHRRAHVPSAEEIAEARGHVGWRHILLLGRDGAGRGAVRLDDPASEVDLGGIAKGYIADKVSETLVAAGITDHLISLGGNVLANGTRPDGSSWQVAIPYPGGAQPRALRLAARDCSVVTSGTYERSMNVGGRRYHHILDPSTCMPASTDLVSATVVARRSIDAEGYSTTLLALGSSRAVPFVCAHPAILRAVLITEAGEVLDIKGGER